MTRADGGCCKNEPLNRLFLGHRSGALPAVRSNTFTSRAFRAFDPRDSLHPFVKSRGSIPGRSLSSGDEGISRENIAQGPVNCLADADARRSLNVLRPKAIVSDPQAGISRGKVAAVVARARYAEGFGQAAWAAGEANQIARSAHLEFSRMRHLLDAAQRFDGAEQHASCLAIALARHIQAVMIAV